MSRYGGRASGFQGERAKENRNHPYKANPRATPAAGSRQLSPREDQQYGPNESLYDRQPVIACSGSAEYDSDDASTADQSLSTSFLQPLSSNGLQTCTPLRQSSQKNNLQPKELIGMLQEQQQQLQTMMSMQQRMKECQSTLERKLSALQEQVTAISSSKSSKSVEKQYRVTRDLTVKFAVDYKCLLSRSLYFYPFI